MNLKKIHWLMNKYNFSCPIRKANPYRQQARALKTSNNADNLLQRELEEYGPRMILLTDITYLPYNGTFAFLSTILDAFTDRTVFIVSHSIATLKELCTRILWLHDGQIRMIGETREVLDRYAEFMKLKRLSHSARSGLYGAIMRRILIRAGMFPAEGGCLHSKGYQ